MTKPTLTVVGKGEPVVADADQVAAWQAFRGRVDAAITAGAMPDVFMVARIGDELECLMTGDVTLAWLARRLAEDLLDDAAGVA